MEKKIEKKLKQGICDLCRLTKVLTFMWPESQKKKKKEKSIVLENI